MIGHKVGVPRFESRVEALNALILPLAVNEDNIWLSNRNHAITVEAESRNKFESFVKDRLFCVDALGVGVAQDADAVRGRAIVVAGFEYARLLPVFRARGTPAIRIFGGFSDPQTPLTIHCIAIGLLMSGSLATTEALNPG